LPNELEKKIPIFSFGFSFLSSKCHIVEIQDLYVGDKPPFKCSLLLRPLSQAGDDEAKDEDVSQVLSFFLASALFASHLPLR